MNGPKGYAFAVVEAVVDSPGFIERFVCCRCSATWSKPR